MHQCLKFAEDRLSTSEIFGWICPFFLSRPKIDSCYTLVIYVVTGPIFIKFAQNVAKILTLNIFESEWQYCNPFWNAAVPHQRWYPNLALKLVATATPLRNRKKRCRSIIYGYIPTKKIVKIGRVNPEIIWLKEIFFLN